MDLVTKTASVVVAAVVVACSSSSRSSFGGHFVRVFIVKIRKSTSSVLLFFVMLACWVLTFSIDVTRIWMQRFNLFVIVHIYTYAIKHTINYRLFLCLSIAVVVANDG